MLAESPKYVTKINVLRIYVEIMLAEINAIYTMFSHLCDKVAIQNDRLK
jgi:hypothetical protein